MIIDYDHNPNITEEQRLQSLKESVQMALNELGVSAVSNSSGNSAEDVSVPIGSVEMFAGATAPVSQGWLMCNGQEVSKETYAKLYAVIGDAYSTHDESAGKFRLPNFNGRVPIGADSIYDLADTGGATTSATDSYALQEADLPKITGGFHIRNIQRSDGTSYALVTSASGAFSRSTAGTEGSVKGGSNQANVGGFDVSMSFGSNGTHNHGSVSTIQPYLAVNYIIYSGVQ